MTGPGVNTSTIVSGYSTLNFRMAWFKAALLKPYANVEEWACWGINCVDPMAELMAMNFVGLGLMRDDDEKNARKRSRGAMAFTRTDDKMSSAGVSMAGPRLVSIPALAITTSTWVILWDGD